MMGKLAVIFVALFVASIAATPSNLLTNLKSLQHVKRAATLLKPLQPINAEKRSSKDEIDMVLMLLDKDNDGMMNTEELKIFMLMGGAPLNEVDMYVKALMIFDKDKNQKLDKTELEVVAKYAGL